jgi:hypothetical protein
VSALRISPRPGAAILLAALIGFVHFLPAQALATELPVPPRRVTPAADIHNYGKTNPKCSSWSDGCRICQRGDAGVAACSNVGIACQAGEVKCTTRRD